MNEEEITNPTDMNQIKEVLKYLVTQEKIRQEEIAALKDAITGVDSYAKDYVDGQNFNAFKDKFGEKLDDYNATFQKTEGPDFDMTRSTYDAYKDLGDDSVSEEQYVDAVTAEADKYIADLKATLGLPEDAAVEITSENGETEVKVDADGDGVADETPEEVQAEAEAEAEPEGEPEPEVESETDAEPEAEAEPEDKNADLDEAAANYKPKH